MDDFEFQLSAQKVYGEGSPPREENRTRTYVDPTDGVAYEWDPDKQGWFPKVSVVLIFRRMRSRTQEGWENGGTWHNQSTNSRED